MRLVVGLGNPGKKYEKNRHNVGFLVLDKLALPWKADKKFNAELCKDADIVYVRPQTFMNVSGQAVSKVMSYYGIDTKDLVVVHDDVDLELGAVKKQFGSGSAGHRGVESIFEALGTQAFWRLRLGIGRPINPEIAVEDFVLQDFENSELEKITSIDIRDYLN